jgi:hypothetical protein
VFTCIPLLDLGLRPLLVCVGKPGAILSTKETAMSTTTCLLALNLLTTSAPSPAWNRDYALAMRQAETAKKPVAVFIASGSHRWKTFCEDSEPGPQVRRLLADHYVCVYVDAAQPSEKALARAFEAGDQPLLVLSSLNRSSQAYRHSGTLARATLAQVLEFHATQETVAPWQEEPAPCRT